MKDEANRYRPRALARRDVLHDQQLLRDMAIINARVVHELGSLPPGGLPVMPKRKSSLLCAALPPEQAPPAPNEDDPMKFSHIAVAASLALAACAPANESLEKGDKISESQGDPMTSHRFRTNPNPHRRYEITMTVKDPPGEFGLVRISAGYKADCWYVIDSFAGAMGQPDHAIELNLKKLNETTYTGVMSLDAMIDEDYYGNGVCHWQLTNVGAGLKATGAHAETRFVAHLDLREVLNQESVTRHFWKKRYPRSDTDNFISLGQADRSEFASEIENGDIFTITLASKEMQP